MISLEVGMLSKRIVWNDKAENSDNMQVELHMLEEVREQAAIKMVEYKQKIARFRNKNLRGRSFKIGDLVLKRTVVSPPGEGKLAAGWE